MKRVLFTLLCMLTMLSYADCQDYYWYKGKQIPLQKGSNRYVIFPSQKANNLEQYQQTGETETPSLMWGIQDVSQPLPIEATYSSPSFKVKADSEKEVYITDRFYVKLKQIEDYNTLLNYAREHNVTIIKASSVPLWYILSCTSRTEGDALQMANLFYESDIFAAAEPEFINTFGTSCNNDTHFDSQWNLNNTGQYGQTYSGLDINCCAAHTITTGNDSIIIAVIDEGVELTHEDLNIYSVSYNTETQTSPSVVYGEHGTACAGIIGAVANNNKGVAGIAPDCPIMSISNRLEIPTSASKLADGFMFATNHNAAVISNSWFADTSSDILTDAIDYALTHGRNGLGCVVVFASGNQSNSVCYPANAIDDIIVVGAMSPCGERCSFISCYGDDEWGSNYGPELDVVAPGIFIPTTDLMWAYGYSLINYTSYFAGTSAACPHVAAVAGLILSVNPYLSQGEVAECIESTAQKVGSYTYSNNTLRPNGTWNNQMGYGLVDAHAAVLAANNMHIAGRKKLCDVEEYRVVNIPSTATVRWSYETDIIPELFSPIIYISDTTDTVITVQRGSTCLPILFDPLVCYYSGIVNLKVAVTDNGETTVYTKQLTLPQDISPTLPPWAYLKKIGWHESRTFTINNCFNVPDDMLKWDITIQYNSSNIIHYGRSWYFDPPSPGIVNIKLYNLENCDSTLYSNYNVTVDWRIPDPLLSPLNPVTSESAEIFVYYNEYFRRCGRDCEGEELPSIDYTLELWDEGSRNIRSLKKSLNSTKDIVKLDVSELRNGIYLLTLRMNNQIVSSNKLIVSR